MGANLRSGGQKGQGLWEQKCKSRFSRMSCSKVDRFTSNQDQNDHRPFFIYRRIHFTAVLRFVLFVCLSVCLSHMSHTFRSLNFQYWNRDRKFIFWWISCASEWWCNSKIKH